MRVATILAFVGVCACGSPKPQTAPQPNVCVKTLTGDVAVPKQQAADILIVVDNSGSMADKQANLVANFLNTDPTQCPLQDLKNIPSGFKNPAPALYTNGGPLAKCGFIQLVAAFDNDFRIGVITTDVGLCDNRISADQGGAFCANHAGEPECSLADGGGWGYRPQRGCLHGDGPPGTNERKVIARADLDDADTTNDDFAARFAATLQNVGTFGSPIERGLDAMNIFLDPASTRSPGCENDLSAFRRKDASLVVIFLSDENDCSHALGGKASAFGDEFAAPTCAADADCTAKGDASSCTNGVCPEVCNEFASGLTQIQGSSCYTTPGQDPDTLSPVDLYVEPLLKVDPKVKVAVIAGGDANGNPAGCLVGADGNPEANPGVCYESPLTNGLENLTAAGEPCAADTAGNRNNLPCCTGDTGDRYFDFAKNFPERAVNSICNASFRDTMIQIAALVAAVDEVTLAEPPDSETAVIVEKVKADKTTVTLDPIPATADCTSTDGYRFDDPTHIQLCGNGRAGPGESISVRARGATKSEECNQPFFEASGGGVRSCASAGVPASLGAMAALLLAWRRRDRVRRG